MSDTAGVKFDAGKPPLSLIPKSALDQEALVLGFGAAKYGRNNWRKGIAWSRLIDATLRHITAFNEGEDFDPETGLSHLAHARCGLAFLIEYSETHKELDDRAKAGDAVHQLDTPSATSRTAPRKNVQPVPKRNG